MHVIIDKLCIIQIDPLKEMKCVLRDVLNAIYTYCVTLWFLRK